MFLVKFHTFGFILEKYATLTHFSAQYMIIKACLTHAHSLYAVVASLNCLEMKHSHRL
jgi:hypothetical protein